MPQLEKDYIELLKKQTEILVDLNNINNRIIHEQKELIKNQEEMIILLKEGYKTLKKI